MPSAARVDWRKVGALVAWYAAAGLCVALCVALVPLVVAFVLGCLLILGLIVAACLPVALLYFALLGVAVLCGY